MVPIRLIHYVILTTPEKWDSITRKWTDNMYLIGSVKLLLLDEVHLLGDGSRGECLETIICCMKTVQRAATRVQQQQHHHHEEERQMLSRFVFSLLFCSFAHSLDIYCFFFSHSSLYKNSYLNSTM